MTEDIKSKLLKIKALAEKGVEGERVAAKAKLAQLMAEHDLTLDDLEPEPLDWYRIRYHSKPDKEIIFQLYRTVCNKGGTVNYIYIKGKPVIKLKMTAAQAIKVFEKLPIYRKAWREEKARVIENLNFHPIVGRIAAQL